MTSDPTTPQDKKTGTFFRLSDSTQTKLNTLMQRLKDAGSSINRSQLVEQAIAHYSNHGPLQDLGIHEPRVKPLLENLNWLPALLLVPRPFSRRELGTLVSFAYKAYDAVEPYSFTRDYPGYRQLLMLLAALQPILQPLIVIQENERAQDIEQHLRHCIGSCEDWPDYHDMNSEQRIASLINLVENNNHVMNATRLEALDFLVNGRDFTAWPAQQVANACAPYREALIQAAIRSFTTNNWIWQPSSGLLATGFAGWREQQPLVSMKPSAAGEGVEVRCEEEGDYFSIRIQGNAWRIEVLNPLGLHSLTIALQKMLGSSELSYPRCHLRMSWLSSARERCEINLAVNGLIHTYFLSQAELASLQQALTRTLALDTVQAALRRQAWRWGAL